MNGSARCRTGRRWRQRVGGALKGCRLVEHVSAIARIARLPGGLGELLGALAIDGGTADGEGLGHVVFKLAAESKTPVR